MLLVLRNQVSCAIGLPYELVALVYEAGDAVGPGRRCRILVPAAIPRGARARIVPFHGIQRRLGVRGCVRVIAGNPLRSTDHRSLGRVPAVDDGELAATRKRA